MPYSIKSPNTAARWVDILDENNQAIVTRIDSKEAEHLIKLLNYCGYCDDTRIDPMNLTGRKQLACPACK